MDRFRRVAVLSAASAAAITLTIDSRFLVPLLVDRSGDANPAAKTIAVLWQVAIALLLALNPKKGVASAAALASLVGWISLAPTGAGAVLFRHWGGIDAGQTGLLWSSLTLQIVAMLAALASRLWSSASAASDVAQEASDRRNSLPH